MGGTFDLFKTGESGVVVSKGRYEGVSLRGLSSVTQLILPLASDRLDAAHSISNLNISSRAPASLEVPLLLLENIILQG